MKPRTALKLNRLAALTLSLLLVAVTTSCGTKSVEEATASSIMTTAETVQAESTSEAESTRPSETASSETSSAETTTQTATTSETASEAESVKEQEGTAAPERSIECVTEEVKNNAETAAATTATTSAVIDTEPEGNDDSWNDSWYNSSDKEDDDDSYSSNSDSGNESSSSYSESSSSESKSSSSGSSGPLYVDSNGNNVWYSPSTYGVVTDKASAVNSCCSATKSGIHYFCESFYETNVGCRVTRHHEGYCEWCGMSYTEDEDMGCVGPCIYGNYHQEYTMDYSINTCCNGYALKVYTCPGCGGTETEEVWVGENYDNHVGGTYMLYNIICEGYLCKKVPAEKLEPTDIIVDTMTYCSSCDHRIY